MEEHLAEAADERLARRARNRREAAGIATLKQRMGWRLIALGSAIAREPGRAEGRRSGEGARIEGRA
jgi:hypothetical protein